jgi:hypothetical protein
MPPILYPRLIRLKKLVLIVECLALVFLREFKSKSLILLKDKWFTHYRTYTKPLPLKGVLNYFFSTFLVKELLRELFKCYLTCLLRADYKVDKHLPLLYIKL